MINKINNTLPNIIIFIGPLSPPCGGQLVAATNKQLTYLLPVPPEGSTEVLQFPQRADHTVPTPEIQYLLGDFHKTACFEDISCIYYLDIFVAVLVSPRQ